MGDLANCTMADAEPELKNKPEDSDFKQQRLKAWQPILTPFWVILTFASVGLVFLIVGILVLAASDEVVEFQSAEYQALTPTGGGSCVQGNASTPSSCLVDFSAAITKDMKAPIYVYYHLTNFYQNHRRYVKSRSDIQLRGDGDYDVDSTCAPLDTRSCTNLAGPPGRVPSTPAASSHGLSSTILSIPTHPARSPHRQAPTSSAPVLAPGPPRASRSSGRAAPSTSRGRRRASRGPPTASRNSRSRPARLRSTVLHAVEPPLHRHAWRCHTTATSTSSAPTPLSPGTTTSRARSANATPTSPTRSSLSGCGPLGCPSSASSTASSTPTSRRATRSSSR